jgi:ribosomal protein S8
MVLSILRVGYLSKRQYVKVPFNKKIISLLKIFSRIRYIKRFQKISEREVKIFLIYNKNMPFYKFTRSIFSSSNILRISSKNLIRLHKYDYGTIYILSTPKGLLTHLEAIQMKKGGLLICVLYS